MNTAVQTNRRTRNYQKLNADVIRNENHSKLAESLFERAVEEINKGMAYKSMDTAREALIYAKYSGSYVRVYIHSFLAMTHMDTRRFSNARIHCWEAINLLDDSHPNFHEDNGYLRALLLEIDRQANDYAASKAA